MICSDINGERGGASLASCRGLSSAIFVEGPTTAAWRGKVGQCGVGLRARLEAGHGVFTGRPWLWSVFPLSTLKYLGATEINPGGAQGYGLTVGFLQEYYVTWFVPHTFVFEGQILLRPDRLVLFGLWGYVMDKTDIASILHNPEVLPRLQVIVTNL